MQTTSIPVMGTVDPIRCPESQEDANTLQAQLDASALELSVAKAIKSVRKDLQAGRVSQSDASVVLLSQLAEQLKDSFDAEVEVKKRGSVRRNGKLSLSACVALPSEAYIALALVTAVDVLGSARSTSKSVTIAALANRIGRVVSTEIMARGVDGSAKAMLARFHTDAKKRSSSMQSRVDGAHALLSTLERQGLEREDEALLGLLLVSNMIAVGVLEKYTPVVKFKARRAPASCVTLPDELVELLEQVAEKLGTRTAARRPRIAPPLKLTRADSRFSTNIGYKHLTFFSGRNQFCVNWDLIESEAPDFFDAANHLQSTGFRVNQRVLDVMLEISKSTGRAWDNLGLSIPRPAGEDIPALPEDPTEEQIADFKKAMREEYNEQADKRRRFRSIKSVVDTAVEFSLQERFFLPTFHDFRGRIYYRADLAPDKGDRAKGLLLFADAAPLGPHGAEALSIHLSACAGDDKISMEERKRWAYDRSNDIVAIARDPFRFRDWSTMDEPWQFLAACFEWAGYIEHGEDYRCGLPLSVDATCSGLQHLSAIRRDPVTAKAVNLRAGEREDVYMAVGEKLLERLKRAAQGDLTGLSVDSPKRRANTLTERAEEAAYKRRQAYATATGIYEMLRADKKHLRRVAKKPTMTLVYGVTTEGIKDTMLEFVREDFADHVGGAGLGDVVAARMLAEMIEQAAREALPDAVKTLAFLREFAGSMASQGKPFEYITPTGFLMHQEYRKPLKESKQLLAQCAGLRLRIRFATGYSSDLDVARAKNGAGANLVHSLDASHLAMTVAAFDAPIATVHDAFHCRPCDLPELQRTLREKFVELYQNRDILTELVEQSVVIHEVSRDSLPKQTPMGEWDVTECLKADYCFS
ncbi:MAG: hypothetical protein HRT56_01620 [Coraliomargarita sp.]|nr:hypothetical protein [Coraliomargarita sp.]